MNKPFRTVLSNGLRVILLETHAAPVVSLNLWANVGSVNETAEEAGLCHLIEHMLFKGTTRRAVGEIARQVEAAGGDMNAYTSFDETVFYINMSSKQYEVGLDILADAASDPTFDQEELTREKEVVVEEISRSEDNPSQMVSQDLFSKAFTTHPYRNPIAGDRNTVRGVSREHLMEFFKKWYVASNLIFIGVGDFNQEKILAQIENLYSKIPAGVAPHQTLPIEPVQKEIRLITRPMKVAGRYFDLAFPAPDLKHIDVPALDMLGQILGGGPSSRLDRALREEKQLVTSIGCSPYVSRFPGLFLIGGVLREKSLRETLQTTFEEIEKMQERPVSTVEFAKARDNIRSSRIYEKQTVQALARKLGHSEGLAEDLHFEDTYYQRLAELDVESLQEVIQKYLIKDKLTLAFGHPEGEKWSTDTIHGWLTQKRPKPIQKSPASSKEIQFFKLPQGIRLIVKEDPLLPLIAIRTASLGGTRWETSKTHGASHLLASVMTKGTTTRTAREIAEDMEGLSGHVDAYSSRNIFGLQATFLSEKMTEGFNLFFDCLLHPHFPEEEIAKEKRHTLTAIRNEEDSLPQLAIRKFLETLYQKHPYALSSLGTLASVKKLTRAQLQNFYHSMIHPKNLVISVVGDVNAEDIRRRFVEKFASLEAKYLARASSAFPKLPKVSSPTKPIEIVQRRKKQQAHLVYGFLGTTLRHNDRLILDVLSAVLSGQGGRLFLELRDKQGLAYTVTTSSQEGIEPGYFFAYMGTDPQKLETALKGVKSELEKVRKELVTVTELERAKKYLIGNYELDLQKIQSVSGLLALNEIYDLPRDEIARYPEQIEAIQREDLRRAAQKYLNPDHAILSIIRP